MNNPRGKKTPDKPCRVSLKNCNNYGIECNRCVNLNKFKLKRARATVYA